MDYRDNLIIRSSNIPAEYRMLKAGEKLQKDDIIHSFGQMMEKNYRVLGKHYYSGCSLAIQTTKSGDVKEEAVEFDRAVDGWDCVQCLLLDINRVHLFTAYRKKD